MNKTSTPRRERYEVETRHGYIGVDTEVLNEDYVDDYAVIDFTVTVTLPYKFREDNTCIKHRGDILIIDFSVSKDLAPRPLTLKEETTARTCPGERPDTKEKMRRSTNV